MAAELRVAPFQMPPGWSALPVDREHPALYRVTNRGNIAVAVDLTRGIAGLRRAGGGVAIPEEASREVLGRSASLRQEFERGGGGGGEATLPEEYARVVVPSRPGAPATELLPLQAEEERLHRTLVLNPETGEYVPAVRGRGVSEIYRRREFGVALIGAEAVRAYRAYLARLPPEFQTQRGFLHGAAYAVYTSYVEAPVFGYFTRAAAEGGLLHEIPQAPSSNLPTVTGEALRPAQLPRDEEFVLESDVGQNRCPVFFQTVAALIYVVNGPNEFRLGLADFDHYMLDIGWQPCGHVPRSNLATWCPASSPIAPELPAQTQLMEGAPPVVYPTHASPERTETQYLRPLEAESGIYVPHKSGAGQRRRVAEDRAYRNAVLEQARKRRAKQGTL